MYNIHLDFLSILMCRCSGAAALPALLGGIFESYSLN